MLNVVEAFSRLNHFKMCNSSIRRFMSFRFRAEYFKHLRTDELCQLIVTRADKFICKERKTKLFK